MTWITVNEAARLAEISRWQMRRRLKTWDKVCGGRLLRWADKPGGKLEVNPAVLRQMLRADPVDRERELSEVHERIDVLDGRTKALRSKVKKHGGTLENHESRLVSQRKSIQLLQASVAELANG